MPETEVNDTMGAAFSLIGGNATDEDGTVQPHAGLANFEGTETPAGDIALGTAPAAGDLVARITIMQAPDLPDWLNFDPATGAFTGTPATEDIGNVDLIVTATDPEGLKVTEEFVLTVNEPNFAPELDNAIVDQVGAAELPFDFTLPTDTFSDPNGDDLALSAEVVGTGGIEVTIENLAMVDGFSLTPFWIGLHNGSFDLFDHGVIATPGLEDLAEEGDASELENEFAVLGGVQVSGIGNADGFPGAPVIEPGETASGVIGVANPQLHRFLSFASMVIPSNDAFVGNENPSSYRVFNTDGSFVGPITIEIFGADIWDAGTEVNDTMGAAFSAIGGSATDEDGMVHPHPGLGNFEGSDTAAGNTIASGAAPGATDLVARITINEAPSLPNWLSFDAAEGRFTGTPTAADIGTVEVTVTAADPGGLSVSDVFDLTIEPANRSPVIVTPIDDQTATEGQFFSFTLPENTFDDPDMDVLSFSAEVAERRDIQVEIENLADVGGFFLTPFWFGMHNGSFDLFDPGVVATNGLELLAEEGDASVLMTEFAAPNRIQISGVGNPDGFINAPIIEPGETATGVLNISNPVAYQYLSYASMVIPSNDAFLGNENPNSHRVFNSDGSFRGPLTIEIFGADIWDAGTEVNNTEGAAFSLIPGTGLPEDGMVQSHPGLENFEGTGTPAGMIVAGATPAADELVARITITEVTTLPDWLSFDPQTRTFSGTPQAADVGTLTLSVIATDDDERNPLSVVDVFDIIVEMAP